MRRKADRQALRFPMRTALRAPRGGTTVRLAVALGGLMIAALTGWSLSSPGTSPEAVAAAAVAPRPNFVVIETDDQTLRQFGRGVMPFTERQLGRKGTELTNYMVTSPFCCPSRGSLLTGQYAHNHGAWNSYETFEDPANTLASWLKARRLPHRDDRQVPQPLRQRRQPAGAARDGLVAVALPAAPAHLLRLQPSRSTGGASTAATSPTTTRRPTSTTRPTSWPGAGPAARSRSSSG